MPQSPPPALLFEMMRSFTTLARTLNLSKAVQELGMTRQTLRRHISLLEEYKGGALFALTDRQYSLTPLGRESLTEAKTLLARTEAWLHNETSGQNGLAHYALQEGDVPYMLQQHPLSDLWQHSSPFLQWGFQTWARAEAQIEARAFQPLRPYLTVFRAVEDDWICTEIGEKSSFASWFGWTLERSSIGRRVADLPGGEGFTRLLSEPFREVQQTHSVRLDHIFTRLPRATPAPLHSVSYQRLIMGCRLPDESLALAALIDRTHNIRIRALPEEMRREMDPEMVMNITPPK